MTIRSARSIGVILSLLLSLAACAPAATLTPPAPAEVPASPPATAAPTETPAPPPTATAEPTATAALTLAPTEPPKKTATVVDAENSRLYEVTPAQADIEAWGISQAELAEVARWGGVDLSQYQTDKIDYALNEGGAWRLTRALMWAFAKQKGISEAEMFHQIAANGGKVEINFPVTNTGPNDLDTVSRVIAVEERMVDFHQPIRQVMVDKPPEEATTIAFDVDTQPIYGFKGGEWQALSLGNDGQISLYSQMGRHHALLKYVAEYGDDVLVLSSVYDLAYQCLFFAGFDDKFIPEVGENIVSADRYVGRVSDLLNPKPPLVPKELYALIYGGGQVDWQEDMADMANTSIWTGRVK